MGFISNNFPVPQGPTAAQGVQAPPKQGLAVPKEPNPLQAKTHDVGQNILGVPGRGPAQRKRSSVFFAQQALGKKSAPPALLPRMAISKQAVQSAKAHLKKAGSVSHLKLPTISEEEEAPKTKGLPAGAVDRLIAQRPEYGKEKKADLNKALDAFKACGYSWAEMKKQYGTKPEMKVIADLRAAQLSYYYEKVKGPEVRNIHDFGSTNPTSDRDFSIECYPGHQDKEILGVKKFNELFQADWGESSAKVFDVNAYTMYYADKFYTNSVKQQDNQFQNEMSLVMFRINSPKDSWDSYKTALLEQNPDLEEQLNLTEKFCHNLDTELDTHILEVRLQELHGEGNEAERLHSILKKGDQQAIHDEANHLAPKDSDLRIRAMNELHEMERTQGKTVYDEREALLKGLDVTDPKEFSAAFKGAVNSALRNQQEELVSVNKTIENLPPNSPQLNTLLDRQKFLAGQVSSLRALRNTKITNEEIAAYCNYNKIRTSLPAGVTIPQRIAHLEGQLQKGVSAQDLSKITKELSDLKRVQNYTAPEWLEDMQIAADDMMIQLHVINAKGRCFAQEIHISEGAFLFVNDVQLQKIPQRTVAQNAQAVNELMGFIQLHQKGDTAEDRMIEISKYVAPRLMVAVPTLQQQGNRLGKPLTMMGGSPNQNQLTGYFRELYPLRGGSIAPETQARGIESYLAQHPDKQHLRPQLMQAKDQKAATALIGSNELQMFYPPEAGQSIPKEQKHYLAQLAAMQYGIPTNNGTVDIKKINKSLEGVHVGVQSWEANLTPEERMTV